MPESTVIVDTHAHVWPLMADPAELAVATVSPRSEVSIQLLDLYLEEHGVQRAVLVQTMFAREDNSYVADSAATRPDRYAAVCVVDPARADAADQLEYWVVTRGCRGLRLRPRFRVEEASFGSPETFALWEKAEQLGVVVNVLASPEHLPAIAMLARRFAGVPIVLDHMAHPDPCSLGAGGGAWRDLQNLAQYPNVFVKISGQDYFSHQPYPHADCQPLVHDLLQHFGPRHLLWGSDFPHVLLKIGYGRALRLVQSQCAGLEPAALDRILGGNALDLYWGRRR